MKHFNRDKLTNADISCALVDLNANSKMTGLKSNYQNKYKKVNNEWVLENKKLKIRDEMKNIEMNHFKQIDEIGLNFDWLSINGNLVKKNMHKGTTGKKISNKKNFMQKLTSSISIRQIDNKEYNKIQIKEIRADFLPIVKFC
jgi:hypothetical protein